MTLIMKPSKPNRMIMLINDNTQISLEHLLQRVAFVIVDHPLQYLFIFKRYLPVRITPEPQLVAFIGLLYVLL